MDPDHQTWATSPLLVLSGLCLFAYQTLDGIDGMQARRTGTGSPLGQLFDHGVDAMVTGFVAIQSITAIGLTGFPAYVTFMGSVLAFVASTWEEYHTHVLYLGKISGPVEGIIGVIAVFILAGFIGTSSFTGNVLGIPKSYLNVVTMIIAAVFYFYSSYTRIVSAVTDRKEDLAATMKYAYTQLPPFLSIIGLGGVWILVAPELMARWPRMTLLMFGQGVVLLITITIVCRMAAARPTLWHPLHAVYLVGFLATITRVASPVLVMFAVSAVVWAFYVHYVVNMILQLATHLKIRVFVIDPPKKKE